MVEEVEGDCQGLCFMVEYLMSKQRESLLRAKRNWRLNHPDKAKKYNKWYYEHFTKPKRRAKSAAKRASLLNRQVS